MMEQILDVIATNVLDKHQVISSFLISLGVAKDVALIDACKLEHDLSEETFNKLKDFCNSIK